MELLCAAAHVRRLGMTGFSVGFLEISIVPGGHQSCLGKEFGRVCQIMGLQGPYVCVCLLISLLLLVRGG